MGLYPVGSGGADLLALLHDGRRPVGALFVVILLDQLREANGKLSAVIAAVSSVACILLFGADQFILPSLLITVTLLALLRGKIEEQDGEERAII